MIWEGRFQPIHRGHLAYVRLLLEHGEHVWVFVVASERSADVTAETATLPVPDFSAQVDAHHVSEKNPLPFWLCYRLVVETLREELPGAPVTVWGGRRLDLAWPFYRRHLPPERAFLTPTRDAFEDAKARAWEHLGEEVVRLDVGHLPRISATDVRSRIAAGKDLSDVLAPATVAILRATGYLGRLREL